MNEPFRPGQIETFTGLHVTPLDMTPEMVRIEDIAHALSNLCRYTGHCKRFISVAEHALMVSTRLRMLFRDADLARFGLLHDAAEAYFNDLNRPLKLEFAEYKAAETRALAVIYKALVGEVPTAQENGLIKKADNDALLTEARELMPSGGEGWNIEGTPFPVPLHFCMSPESAERALLNEWRQLEEVG